MAERISCGTSRGITEIFARNSRSEPISDLKIIFMNLYIVYNGSDGLHLCHSALQEMLCQ